jgi:hypothetical protein
MPGCGKNRLRPALTYEPGDVFSVISSKLSLVREGKMEFRTVKMAFL